MTPRHWSDVERLRVLAPKKPSTEGKASRCNKKLAARSLPGVWLGSHLRTDEHIIALDLAEAIRVRTVHRLPELDRWSIDVVLGVRALPRRPNPNNAEREPAPRMNIEHGDENCEREDSPTLANPSATTGWEGPTSCGLRVGCSPRTATQRAASDAPTRRPNILTIANTPLHVGDASVTR